MRLDLVLRLRGLYRTLADAMRVATALDATVRLPEQEDSNHDIRRSVH